VDKRARVIDLLEEPTRETRIAEVEVACKALVEGRRADMEEVVGELSRAVTRARTGFSSSTAGNWITDCMRARTGAAIAFHNRGGIRSDIPAGSVTRRELFEMCPFGNHLVTLGMDGRALLQLAQRAVNGRSASELELSGLTLEVRMNRGRAQLVAVRVGGEPLDLGAHYRLTTNSFLAGGAGGFESLARLEQREVDLVLLRDALESCLGVKAFTPPGDDRYRIVP
jgi:2',3'-cyclic-nucleotide 2'-phosphodiesterase (5'-nucleotidase family)